MSPRISADACQPGTRPNLRVVPAVRPGEVRLTCPLDGCDWSTVRPAHAAASCAAAHRIAHRKGWS